MYLLMHSYQKIGNCESAGGDDFEDPFCNPKRLLWNARKQMERSGIGTN